MGKAKRQRRQRSTASSKAGAGTHVSLAARRRTQAEMTVVEQTSAMDRAWFEAHPLHKQRLRTGAVDEFTAEYGERCPEGMAVAVSVEQVREGVRMRIPIGLLPLHPGHTQLTPDQLDTAWKNYCVSRRYKGLPLLVADEILATAAEFTSPDGTPDIGTAMAEVMMRTRLAAAAAHAESGLSGWDALAATTHNIWV